MDLYAFMFIFHPSKGTVLQDLVTFLTYWPWFKNKLILILYFSQATKILDQRRFSLHSSGETYSEILCFWMSLFLLAAFHAFEVF